ncbi:hypothetical protein X768_14585 [Mesorhizobium sp. LSJC265A00]|nr:hypothetical protein X768_14585 [Mesorhizobium sp. LSJC265A00]
MGQWQFEAHLLAGSKVLSKLFGFELLRDFAVLHDLNRPLTVYVFD